MEKINQILGTKLELRRVALRDLEELHEAISARIGTAAQGQPTEGLLNAPLVEILRKKLAHKKLEDMTVRDFLSILQEGGGGKGPLGFGILPALLRGRR